MACKLSRSLLTSTSATASFPSSPFPSKPPHLLKPTFFLPSVTALSANGNSSQQGEAIQHSRKDPLQQGRRPRDSSVLLLDSWDPFSRGGLRQMMETMDRLFLDDWAPARGGGGRGSNRSSGSAGVRAPWDVVEDEEAYHIRVDMPGFSKEDVKVYIEDGVLVVSAERDQSKEESRWAAKSYNKFNTRLALPDNVQMDKVSAEMKNGVLFVVVPKVKPEERKKVLTVDIS